MCLMLDFTCCPVGGHMRDVFAVCGHSYGRLLRTISCGVMLTFLRTLCWYFCGHYVGIFVVCGHSYGRLLRTICCGRYVDIFADAMSRTFFANVVGIFADVMLVFLRTLCCGHFCGHYVVDIFCGRYVGIFVVCGHSYGHLLWTLLRTLWRTLLWVFNADIITGVFADVCCGRCYWLFLRTFVVDVCCGHYAGILCGHYSWRFADVCCGFADGVFVLPFSREPACHPHAIHMPPA